MRRLFAVALWAGCYAPEPQPGAPCPNGICPSGLTCSPATGTCEVNAIDAQTNRDSSVEIDTLVIDAPPSSLLRQQVTNYAENVTSLSATFPVTPAAGQMLVMIGANLSGSITTVSGGSASWERATSSLVHSNVEVWIGASNGIGGTVTIARPATSAPMWMAISEWSGLAAMDSLDGTDADSGTGNPVNAGSITTTHANDLLLFAATTHSPNTHTSPTPGTWTTMTPIAGTTISQGAWFRVVTAAGIYTPAVTQTSTEGWEAAVVALRIAP